MFKPHLRLLNVSAGSGGPSPFVRGETVPVPTKK